MVHRRMGFVCLFALTSLSILVYLPTTDAQETKRPFTVADEIGLRFFGGGEGNRGAAMVAFSPDGKYVAIDTERGCVDTDRVEDSLRFYRTEDMKSFLAHSERMQPPTPVWIMTAPPQKDGSVIND